LLVAQSHGCSTHFIASALLRYKIVD